MRDSGSERKRELVPSLSINSAQLLSAMHEAWVRQADPREKVLSERLVGTRTHSMHLLRFEGKEGIAKSRHGSCGRKLKPSFQDVRRQSQRLEEEVETEEEIPGCKESTEIMNLHTV